MRLSIPLILLIFAIVVSARREYKRHYYGRNRHTKQVHRYANSPLDCELHEHFERCGQEAHCDLSCENFMNPPSCQAFKSPKCFYPRCICDPGYVRHHGRCVLETYCTKHHHHTRKLFK